jgi:hypothetical protein
MPDYQQGKVYKITAGSLTYIGSTCEPTLARRLASHVKDFKRWKNGNRGFVTSFSLIETNQYEISVLELVACNSKDELRARERFYIETIPCVNKCTPLRNQEERWNTNHNNVKEKHKLYYEENKEKIREQQNTAYKENPEPKQKYREKNREHARLYAIQYRLKKKNLNPS